MIAKTVDLFTTYQFLKRLVIPFEKWDAFKLGIIDAEGTVLKPMETLETQKERDAWGYFDILAANLKKLLGKLPGGKTAIASYAAAFLLLRENNHLNANDFPMVLERLETTFDECLIEAADHLYEEVPVNNASGGAIAGLTPPDVVVKKKKTKNILTRRPVNNGTN